MGRTLLYQVLRPEIERIPNSLNGSNVIKTLSFCFPVVVGKGTLTSPPAENKTFELKYLDIYIFFKALKRR